ncbi:MAG: hypothetical protein ACTSPE_10130 [Candidatus Thorarchaeota archaeon]
MPGAVSIEKMASGRFRVQVLKLRLRPDSSITDRIAVAIRTTIGKTLRVTDRL